VVADGSAVLTIDEASCYSVHFLCASMRAGVGASYTDVDETNNVACKNIDAQKICKPGVCGEM